MPLPNLIEGQQILTDTIDCNLHHVDYNRTLCVKKDYVAYTTGVGISEKLHRFVMRESKELFAQRLRLTQAITPDIVNSIMNPMYKVSRTPASVSLEWKEKETSERNREGLLEVAKKFYGSQSVDKYLSYRMVELDTTDPNSFIAIEFKEAVDPTNPELKANPYPYEIKSENAVNYQIKNNELQFLIDKVVCCKQIMGADKKKTVHLNNYTQYLKDYTIVAKQVYKDELPAWKSIVSNYEVYVRGVEMAVDKVYLYTTGEKKENDRKYYSFEVFNHMVPYVPAKRVGTRRDLTTDGRTCVPLMHPAQAYLEKSIKTMSEFDLSNVLHTFPQKIQYTDACQGEQQGQGQRTPCHNGLTPIGNECNACHGTGYKVHKSAQDIIQVRMPKDIKDMVSLDNVLTYKSPPIDLLTFQKSYGMYELRHAAIRAVYNSDVFSRDEIAVTATEKNIDLDAVYDTLKPFADNYSDMWSFIMQTIAELRDMASNLSIAHTFPKDFKMKPYTMLLGDLQLANQNNAPSHIKKAITKDITRHLYIDQPIEIVKIETKDKYYPFPGKSENEVNYIIANDLTTTKNKTLYAHFDKVFNEIEFEQSKLGKDFYRMDETMQRVVIDEKVLEIILEMENEDFASTSASLNINNQETELNNKTEITNTNEVNNVEAEAKAKLKGSVGGVQGILAIQASVVEGATDYSSALGILDIIYGISDIDARRILGEPRPPKIDPNNPASE